MWQNALTPTTWCWVISQDQFSGKAPNPGELQEPSSSQTGASRTCLLGEGSISILQPPLTEATRSPGDASSLAAPPQSPWYPEVDAEGVSAPWSNLLTHSWGLLWVLFCFVYHLANEGFVCVCKCSVEETCNLSCLCWHCFICSLNTSRDCTEILRVVKCLIPYLAQQ